MNDPYRPMLRQGGRLDSPTLNLDCVNRLDWCCVGRRAFPPAPPALTQEGKLGDLYLSTPDRVHCRGFHNLGRRV